jgi:hypothetical protein
MQVAVQKLGDRLKELQWREEDHRRQIAYDKVKAERDALAEELARVYPPVAAQLAELFGRVEANNREVKFINRRLPTSQPPSPGNDELMPCSVMGDRILPRATMLAVAPAQRAAARRRKVPHSIGSLDHLVRAEENGLGNGNPNLLGSFALLRCGISTRSMSRVGPAADTSLAAHSARRLCKASSRVRLTNGRLRSGSENQGRVISNDLV